MGGDEDKVKRCQSAEVVEHRIAWMKSTFQALPK